MINLDIGSGYGKIPTMRIITPEADFCINEDKSSLVWKGNMPCGKYGADIISRLFHYYFYCHLIGGRRFPKWFGHTVLKNPLDLWAYQALLFEIKPRYIIETGTYEGGTTIFLAHMLDILGQGQIITVDIEPKSTPFHERCAYLVGSSIDPDIIEQIKGLMCDPGPVIVILDSTHVVDHVFQELKLYSDLVTIDSYLLVEDTNLNGHPVNSDYGSGPMEAINRFLERDNRFIVDREREFPLLSFMPNGFLKRVK